MPVWLPWLGAPLFLLLPMAGCGLADSLRAPEMLRKPLPAAVTERPVRLVSLQPPLAMTVAPVVQTGPPRRRIRPVSVAHRPAAD